MAKNSRAKVSRTRKNYGIDLSSEIEIPESIESFSTRDQFNEWKEKMRSFTNRNNLHYQFIKNEHGVVISKAEYNKIERETRRAQRIHEEMVRKYQNRPFISGGKETGMTVAERQEMLAVNRQGGFRKDDDFIFEEVKSPEDLKRIKSRVERHANPDYYEKSMETLKDNFIKSVEGSFNSLGDELVSELRDIPADYFYEMFLTYDEISFKFFDSDGQKVTATEHTVNQIMTYVERFKKNQINFDLKGF